MLFSGFGNASDEEEPPPENDTEDEGEPDPFAPFASLPTDDPLHQGEMDSITLGEVMLAMFDWVASHKATKAATADVWSMLRAVCPPGTSPGTYAMAER